MTGGWWCWTVPASSNNQPQLHRAQAAWCNLTHTHDLHHSTTTSHNQHQNTPLTSTITQPPLHAQPTPQNLHLHKFINLKSNVLIMITIKCSKWNRICSICSVHIDVPTVPYLANGTLIQCQSVNPWFFHSLTDVDSVDCRRLASNLSTNHRAWLVWPRAGCLGRCLEVGPVWCSYNYPLLTSDQAPQMSDSCTATLIMWYLVCRLQFLRNDPHFTRACSRYAMLPSPGHWIISLPYSK